MVIQPTTFWIVAGLILCLMELFLPTAFVEFVMGLSALVVAGISLIITSPAQQVAIWMALSLFFVWLSRRFFPPQHSAKLMAIADKTEGETLTDIPAGKAGRVLYDGNSWRAICDDETLAIAPQQKVVIIRREGNTLFVLPEKNLGNHHHHLPRDS